MKVFKDKVVVITGAGSGIGKALATAFAQRGARLALSDIHESHLEAVTIELSKKTPVFSQVFDVAKEEAMQKFAKAVYTHYNQVDIMLNNAGVAQGSIAFSEISSEDFQWLIDINLNGVIYGSRYFLPYLRKQQESHLVNISSIFGMIGVPGQTIYNTSKFAVRGFTESLALEERYNKTGVIVTVVHPGGIQTNILKNAHGIEQSKVAEQEKMFITPPQKAAQAIIKGIQKKRNRVFIGRDAYLIYYVNKFLRKLVQKVTLHLYHSSK